MPSHKPKKRRILRTLKIDEISGVDRPAQEGARAVIMKRVEDDDGSLSKNSALTTAEEGHQHLLALFGPPDGVELTSGTTSWNDEHDHPWIMTEDGQIVIGESRRPGGEPHTHGIAAMSKVSEEGGLADPLNEELKASKAADAANSVGTKEDNTMPNTDDKTVDAEKLTAKIDTLTKDLERANSIADLNDSQKAHFTSLEGDEASGFLAKSDEDRQELVDKIAKQAADADAIIYTSDDGDEFRKSDDPRFVAQAKRADKEVKLRKAAEKKADIAEYTKRAETELGNLPGSVEVRAKLLKAAEAIDGDEDEDEGAVAALKAHNAVMGKVFTTSGTVVRSEPLAKAEDALDKLAKDYAKENKVSMAKAESEVLRTDEGRRLYAESIEHAAPTIN